MAENQPDESGPAMDVIAALLPPLASAPQTPPPPTTPTSPVSKPVPSLQADLQVKAMPVGKEAAATGLPHRKRHWEMLVVATLIVVLACLLKVMPDQEHIAFRGFEQWVIPGSCLSREMFGVSCPGCGLTRSIVYIAHGDLQSSFRLHRLGWLLAMSILLQFPYRIACLNGYASSPSWRLGAKIFANTLTFLLIANWLLGFVLHG